MAKQIQYHGGTKDQAQVLMGLIPIDSFVQLSQPVQAKSFDDTDETIIGVKHDITYGIVLMLKGAKKTSDGYPVQAFPVDVIGSIVRQVQQQAK